MNIAAADYGSGNVKITPKCAFYSHLHHYSLPPWLLAPILAVGICGGALEFKKSFVNRVEEPPRITYEDRNGDGLPDCVQRFSDGREVVRFAKVDDETGRVKYEP